METYNRLELIRELLKKFNKFYISVVKYDDKIPVSYATMVFFPIMDRKGKNIIVNSFEEEYQKDRVFLEELHINTACRKILTLIRDFHTISIESINKFYQHKSKKSIIISFQLEKYGENWLDEIDMEISKVKAERKKSQNWDHDSIIWPIPRQPIGRNYFIKDVYDALSSNDLLFIKTVHKEGAYNDFLLSSHWDPIRLLGDPNNFMSIKCDDFGDYDPYDNALIVAAKNNSYECLEYLLRSGSDANFTDHSGQTALHICAINNFSVCFQALLDYGAKLNLLDKFGYTPEKYVKKYRSLDCEIHITRRFYN